MGEIDMPVFSSIEWLDFSPGLQMLEVVVQSGCSQSDSYLPHESLPWNPLMLQMFYRRGVIVACGRKADYGSEITDCCPHTSRSFPMCRCSSNAARDHGTAPGSGGGRR